MEMLRRLLGEGESECGCGHPIAVHWRHDEGNRLWCSAPGCACSREAVAEELTGSRPEEGDGFRIVPTGSRGRRTA